MPVEEERKPVKERTYFTEKDQDSHQLDIQGDLRRRLSATATQAPHTNADNTQSSNVRVSPIPKTQALSP